LIEYSGGCIRDHSIRHRPAVHHSSLAVHGTSSRKPITAGLRRRYSFGHRFAGRWAFSDWRSWFRQRLNT